MKVRECVCVHKHKRDVKQCEIRVHVVFAERGREHERERVNPENVKGRVGKQVEL